MSTSILKAVGLAALGGGGVSLAAATTSHWTEAVNLIKTFGLPTALVIVLMWAFWEAVKREHSKSDDRDEKYHVLQMEFRTALYETIAKSNQLQERVIGIQIEQTKTLTEIDENLKEQSFTLREMNAALKQSARAVEESGGMSTVMTRDRDKK